MYNNAFMERYHKLTRAYKVAEEIRDSFKLGTFTKELAMTTLYVALFIVGGVIVGLWALPSLAAFVATATFANVLNQLFYKAPRYLLALRTIRSIEG